MTNEQTKQNTLANYGLAGAAAAAVTTALVAQPAHATVQEVQDTVTAVGAVAGLATTIVLGAMGVRIAIKQVNRVSSKA